MGLVADTLLNHARTSYNDMVISSNMRIFPRAILARIVRNGLISILEL